MLESTPPPELNFIRRANRSILLSVLFAGTVFSLIFTELGMSVAVGLCLDAGVVLIVLQILLRGTTIHILYVFPVGVVLALVMLKTGQLWTVIMAHGLNNLIATLLLEFNVPELPNTPVFGVSGLVVAAAAFWVAVRWLGLPESPAKENEGAEKKSIWTTSLVIVLILTAIAIVETTYTDTALGPGVETAL